MATPLAYATYGWVAGVHQHPVIMFNGEILDDSSGGYHLGQGKRMYLPAIMRFASPDDLSPFLAGGLNAYAYCQGDPVNFTDPSGNFPTLKQLSQKVLKRQGHIVKHQKMLENTVPLEWEKTPRGPALLEKYKTLQAGGKTEAQILHSNPDLKYYVKLSSREAGLRRLNGKFVSNKLILVKHRDLVNRAHQSLGAYFDANDIDFSSSSELGVHIQGATKFGLSEHDSQKLLKWIRGRDGY